MLYTRQDKSKEKRCDASLSNESTRHALRSSLVFSDSSVLTIISLFQSENEMCGESYVLQCIVCIARMCASSGNENFNDVQVDTRHTTHVQFSGKLFSSHRSSHITRTSRKRCRICRQLKIVCAVGWLAVSTNSLMTKLATKLT